MNIQIRAIAAVGRITNPWNEPLPTPEYVTAQAAAIGHLILAACRGVESLAVVPYFLHHGGTRFGA